MQQDFTQVPPDFGHWLAGLVDGEGCFWIACEHDSSQPRYKVRFGIGLRDDDRATLELCQRVTGIGKLYLKRRSNPEIPNQRPYLTWCVSKKTELLCLVRIFDQFPLRSKKARDYAIWREAVIHVQSISRVPFGGSHRGFRAADWGPLPQLFADLKRVRMYEQPEVVEDEVEVAPQLELLDGRSA